jgi:hypothetical protein
MIYTFISSDPDIREQITVNYRFYAIKRLVFALLTDSGEVIVREVKSTFIQNPLYKKGNFPIKQALSELVDLNTSAAEKQLARDLGVKLVKLEVEPFGRRSIVDDDRLYKFDPLE